jgi:hypothetical protein
VSDFLHEGFCDTQNNISKSCNCLVGYPLEVIDDLNEEIQKLKIKLKEAREETIRLKSELNKPSELTRLIQEERLSFRNATDSDPEYLNKNKEEK